MRSSSAWTVVALVLILSGCASEPATTVPPQAQSSEQQQLVDRARLSVEALRADKVVGGAVNSSLTGARGVLIFPNLLRAGFVLGAAGGTGVLLARTASGGWTDPAFYVSGEGSFGLQIGAEAGQVLFIIRNDGTLNKIMNGNVNLGGDVSIAVGPFGGGAAGATTPNVGADLVAFSVQEGIFGGATIQGGVINPRQGWNDAYYGPGATPRAIVLENRFHNPGAQGLKTALMAPR
jgi:SH3 domain-containing YSC84-like protein 1